VIMPNRHQHRESLRTPEEVAQLQADRERYQREKPTPEQLLAEGGHGSFVPLRELLAIRRIGSMFKREREQKGMTLAELSAKTGMDQATLSRLENGKNLNPTLDTLFRVAAALQKVFHADLVDAPPEEELTPV